MIDSLLRSLKCRQVGQVQVNISVDGTSATPVASGPDAELIDSITDIGAGNYTIVLKEAMTLAPFCSGLVSLTDQAIGIVTASTLSSITVQFKDPATGLAKDADFNIQLQLATQLSYYL